MGQNETYSITVTNTGTTAANDVMLTDPLPNGLTYVSSSSTDGTGGVGSTFGNVSQSGGVVTDNIGTLAAGQSVTMTIIATPTQAGSVQNSAFVTTSSGVANTSNSTATNTTNIASGGGTVNLSVTKTASATDVVGQALTYTITATNNSTTDQASDVTLTDTLPSGATLVSDSASQGAVSVSGGTITGQLDTLLPGQSATMTIIVVPTAAGTLSNTASISGAAGTTNTGNGSATATTTVSAAGSSAADLMVTKTNSIGSGTVLPGQLLTYTITVTNQSTMNAASNVVLTDALPAGLIYAGASSASGTSSGGASLGTVTQTNGTVTDTLGTLAPGASATLTMNVIPTASGPIQNTALATTDSGVSNASTLSATNNATIGAMPATAADLRLTKVDSAVGTPIVPGTTFAYILTVVNNSTTNAAENVVINDTLPAGLTYLGSTSFVKAAGPTGASASGGTVTQTGGSLSDAIGTLAPGASATLEIVVTAAQPGPLTNTATATTTSGTLNTSALVATDSTIVGSLTAANEANLSITKTASPTTVLVGQNETYTITVTNNSATNEAANTTVADLLPAGTMYVSGVASQGTVSEANGIISANLGTLGPNGSATITVTLMPTTAGTVTNTAVVSTSSGNTNTTTSATATTTVSAAGANAANISVTKTVSSLSQTAGSPVTYTLTVTNNGSTDATDAIVTDALDPAGLAFISATSSAGTVSQAGGIVTANLGTLAAGQSATITITALPTLIGPIANTAVVSTSAGNTNANPTATTTTTINAAGTSGADVSVTKTASPASGTVGQNETYTLVVTNNSTTNAASDVVVSDAIPGGMSYVSSTSTVGTISQSGGTVSGSLGTLAPGASATITVTLMPGTAGSVTNTAVVSTSSGDSDLSNNTATATTSFAQQTSGVNLVITKTHSSGGTTSIVPGQALSYTITVTNSGTSDAENVVISDPFPTGLLFISDTSTSGTSGTGSTMGAVSMSGSTLSDAIGTLAAGQSVTLTIQTMPMQAGTLTNTATVTTTSQNNNSNNTATDTATVSAASNSAATLSITKTASASTGTVGQNETYTITVTNTGGTTANDVVISDPLGATLTFVSATSNSGAGTSGASMGTVSQSGGLVSDNIGDLAAGQSVTLTIVATPTQTGPLQNTAFVTTSSGVTNPGNSSVTIVGTINDQGGGGGGGGGGTTACYVAGQLGDGTDATFIHNLYRELLGREPDPAGQAAWLKLLSDNGGGGRGNNRQTVINGFISSQEYREHVVGCLYENFLGRAADPGGLQFFVGLLAAHRDEFEVLRDIVGSQEYLLRNGGTSQGFVDALYRDIMGRAPDAGGEAYWTSQVNGLNGNGNSSFDSRDAVVRAFVLSPEGLHRLLDGNYLVPGGGTPLASPGSPQAGAYPLANVTGNGFENLYFHGNLNQSAVDNFFAGVQGREINERGDEDALVTLLATDQYYG